MTNSSKFFENLLVLDSFFQVSNPKHYRPLPDDWFIGVTDIQNSTHAIEHNRYKWVNILGASPIVGLLNASKEKELPFSFGGDGCVICFPPDLLESAKTVFAACQKIGKSEFELNLRAAIIPVADIRKKGFDVKIAKFRVSEFYNQSVFIGGGLNYAEKLLKNNAQDNFQAPVNADTEEVNFSGLECRWQEVSPQNKSVITLLIQSNPHQENSGIAYDEVFKKLKNIYGFDDNTNPVPAASLKMNMSVPKLMGEVRFRTFGKGWLGRLMYLLKVQFQILLGKIFMKFGYKSSATDWNLYKPDLGVNNDHRKFDDMLRLVISGTAEQHQKLKEFLDDMFKDSALAYGIHASNAAMITCMVFKYHRQHIHFIDGSNGGYAMAAKDLKARLEKLK